MKPLPHLLFKFILFSMILIVPAMMAGNDKSANSGVKVLRSPVNIPYYSSAVIKRFMSYRPSGSPLYREGRFTAHNNQVKVAAPLSSDIKKVIYEATSLYDKMNLAHTGLNEEAFEYAWRGYHNLLRRHLLHRTGILSICDFSQSSHRKRMYIIDVRHKKLLFNTYVAHGQNSGTEYASSFSNLPESGKSSLGFYVTGKTYYGRNGLSLKIVGVDRGYNDLACKRNIVLHGSAYISPRYLNTCGEMGTSLGCPAIPSPVSPRIIKAVKNGSCLFIYHPTKTYLDGSTVLHS